jgi:hypothetical protein
MSGGGWQKIADWSYTMGLTGLVGLNLAAAGLVAIGSDMVKPVLAQDGVYLYGEADTTNQLGKGYFIFQRSGQRIVGALYYPQSEYTCFTGTLSATNAQLQPFEAGDSSASGQTIQVALPSLHQIANVGSSERKTLAMCKQEASALVPSRTAQTLPRL